jgi:hypothetical protein
MAAKGIFGATDLIGGGAGALDAISSANGKVIITYDVDGHAVSTASALETGDSAIVLMTSGIYFYTYDSTLTTAEDSTNYTIIKPDNLGGGDPGRWVKEYHISSWGSESAIQIATGVAALSGQGRYRIQVETGAADDLDKLTGLENGHVVILVPDDAAKPITVKHGTFLKLQKGKDFTMNNVRDKIYLLCEGSDLCSEINRVSIES